MTTPALQTLLDRLNNIALTSKTSEKEVFLRDYLKDPEFRTLVDLMLNPYKTYGITDFNPMPVRAENGPFDFSELVALADELASRRLSGNNARNACGTAVACGVPADLMIRILEGDPKAGFGVTLVNKVMPGLLPEFPYMRCSLPEKSNMDKWDWEKGVLSQLKADGMFMNVNQDIAGQVQLLSRQGQIFPTKGFEAFHDAVRKTMLPNTQTHGEMVVFKDGKILPRELGNGIINSVAQGGDWGDTTFQFMAWDQIPLSEVKPKNKYKVRNGDRFMNLVAQVQHGHSGLLTHIPYRIVHSKKEAYEHFAEVLAAGGEGTVPKNQDGFWMDGTSKDQVKLKLEFIVDVEITGFTQGKGKFAKTFGAITYKTRDDHLCGQVSGIPDDLRQYVSDNRDKFLGTIMAVEANAITRPSASNAKYSLSHPRVSEFRKPADKAIADSLEECFDQMHAAINSAAEIKVKA